MFCRVLFFVLDPKVTDLGLEQGPSRDIFTEPYAGTYHWSP